MLLFFSAKICNSIGDIKDDVYDCCSSSNQCGLNEGDCELNSDCSGNLICGNDNCPPHFPSDADCCSGNFMMLLIRSNLDLLKKIQNLVFYFKIFAKNVILGRPLF